MTSIEANKARIKENCMFCQAAHICRYRAGCFGKHCQDCEFYEDTGECINAMLAEHKEQIKLKPWEYELIDYTNRITGKECYFSGYAVLNYMKVSGYFEGISNTAMTLREIPDNCEVIEDD